jgi:signal transduction histidine kinase
MIRAAGRTGERLTTSSERWNGGGTGIRRALNVGFALVFALWMAWGYQLVRAFQEMEQAASSAYDDYVRGEQALSRIRTNVLLASIYLRDALIDAAIPRREESQRELARLREDIEPVLNAQLRDVVSPIEREHWVRLQGELTAYWASREIALTEAGVRGAAEAGALLRRRVVPSRDTVLQILDQLAAMHTAAHERHQAETAETYRRVGQRLAIVGLGTMVLALVVAVVASRHVRRLERHVHRQRLTEQQSREELERLSASLVDVQESERQSLARELHDEVGQALTALKMDIGVALRSDVDPRAKAALEEAKDIAENTLRSVRDLSQLLHPSTLDDFGLPATLSAYLRSFSTRTGIRARLVETFDDRLASQLEVGVYRIVQEALNNIAQHSGATACTVSLTGGEGRLRLVIEDNGGGISRGSGRRGLGMIGMRERAQGLGGSFAIEDRPGGGARITVMLPAHAARVDAGVHREAV